MFNDLIIGVFVFIFAGTGIVTLLGVTGVIKVEQSILNKLVIAVLIEVTIVAIAVGSVNRTRT